MMESFHIDLFVCVMDLRVTRRRSLMDDGQVHAVASVKQDVYRAADLEADQNSSGKRSDDGVSQLSFMQQLSKVLVVKRAISWSGFVVRARSASVVGAARATSSTVVPLSGLP